MMGKLHMGYLFTVSNNILLEKLDHYGIRGISNDWFRSYLSDRSQFVSINGFNSDLKTIKYGLTPCSYTSAIAPRDETNISMSADRDYFKRTISKKGFSSQ